MKTMSRLGLGLVLVLGLSVFLQAQTLTGSWTTRATIVASPVTLGIDSELVVTYNVSTWSFAANTALDETGWTRQRFVASGTLGEITFASTRHVRRRQTPRRSSRSGPTTATCPPVRSRRTAGTFSLRPGDVEFVLDGSGSLGAVDVRVVLRSATRRPPASATSAGKGVGITVEFPFCAEQSEATSTLTCGGFESTLRATKPASPTCRGSRSPRSCGSRSMRSRS